MSENLYVEEIMDLRNAIRTAINELDDANLGEGLSYNVYYIRRDLQKALTNTISARTRETPHE